MLNFRGLFICAVLVMISANANAQFKVFADGNQVYGLNELEKFVSEPIEFDNVCRDGSSIDTSTVTITNDSHFDYLDFLVSIPGNTQEIYITTYSDECLPIEDVTLEPADTCTIELVFFPQHFGNKKKKLNLDGFYVIEGIQYDVSVAIPITGKSDPFNNPNGDCYVTN